MPLYFFFDPTLEQLNVVLIDAAMLHEAEKLLESCEHCKGKEPRSPSMRSFAGAMPPAQ
jgi:hypothetical protein